MYPGGNLYFLSFYFDLRHILGGEVKFSACGVMLVTKALDLVLQIFRSLQSVSLKCLNYTWAGSKGAIGCYS